VDADPDERTHDGPGGPAAAAAPEATPEVVREGGAAYERSPMGTWSRAVDGEPVVDATDLTLADLFDPPHTQVDGVAVRLVPRAWASRHPDHPLAWTFEYADLGARGPIPVPVDAWDERAGRVVAMGSAELHPWNLITVDGVAALLGVGESTVRAYLARRQMPEPLLRLGRVPVWPRSQIEAWHATRTRARPPAAPSRPGADDEDVPAGGTDDDR
jgi:predicted DNA-binding transcriptional regulator AlpA